MGPTAPLSVTHDRCICVALLEKELNASCNMSAMHSTKCPLHLRVAVKVSLNELS
jgi:hypothetical protein